MAKVIIEEIDNKMRNVTVILNSKDTVAVEDAMTGTTNLHSAQIYKCGMTIVSSSGNNIISIIRGND